MENNAIFVDTNILVYANTTTSPFYQAARDRLGVLANQGNIFWIGRQILREYLGVMSRPNTLSSSVSVQGIISDINRFGNEFQIAKDGPVVFNNLLRLIQTVAVGGKQIHDTNIVATMQAHGITQLLTHNVKDFDRFSAYITVLPLEEVSPPNSSGN